MFFFIKIFSLSGFFNPDLRQYRIKFALFTARKTDFSVKCTDWSLGNIRQTQHKRTHDQQRTFEVMITAAATAGNIQLIV